MTVSFKARVRTASNEITTLAALADAGRLEYRTGNICARDGRLRTAYFASEKGEDGSWEIGRMAYQSRTGQKVTLYTPEKIEAARAWLLNDGRYSPDSEKSHLRRILSDLQDSRVHLAGASWYEPTLDALKILIAA